VQAGGPARALGVAAHRTESELLLEMLAGEIGPGAGGLEVLPSTSGLADVLARMDGMSPEVVCVGSFPPEGGPYARRLFQGIKARFPGTAVIAFRPSEPGVDPARAAGRLREAGADVVVATLADASAELSRLLLRV
jgi:hypothetical protein